MSRAAELLFVPKKSGFRCYSFEPNNIALLNFIGVALLYSICVFGRKGSLLVCCTSE